MKHHCIATSLTTTAILILTCGLSGDSVAAQGTGGSQIRFDEAGRILPEPGGRVSAEPAPRLPDSTTNLGRTGTGKGAWINKSTRYSEGLVDPPKSQGIPFQPWARALQQYRDKVTLGKEDPEAFCIPPPTPYTRGGTHPIEFIQLPEQKRIVQLTEYPGRNFREIFMDGRAHPPKEDLENFPTFTGHAIGRWEGDTLVVDTVGFNEGTWMDAEGNPHTSQLHLIEKYTRTSLNNLHIETRIDDPGAYTRPWAIAVDLVWGADFEIVEFLCQGNNRWQENYVKETKGANGTGNAGADFGQGHPAKGSFVGEWGPNANTRDSLVVLMDWDGKAITGAINPGKNQVPITRAELNLENWTLHIQGGTGAASVVLDGKFENLTWLSRSLTGTYTRGNQRGTFKITRQH